MGITDRPEHRSFMPGARPTALPASPDDGFQRWHSREWEPIRRAVYRTLVDMTVFPTLSPEGVPMLNALRQTAVEHGLIDAVTSQPSERLLRLNPGQGPGVTR